MNLHRWQVRLTMDRHERRRRRRIEEKLRKKLGKEPMSKETSSARREHVESLPQNRKGRRYLTRAISRTKLLWGIVVSALTLLGGYALLRPHVSIEPGLLLNPGDPFSTQFDVTNDSLVFDIKDLNPSCYTVFVETTNRVRLNGLPPRPSPSIPWLGAREKTTTSCPPWIGGLGAGAGNVTTAYIVITILYRQEWWPFQGTQAFPLKGVVDSQKGVHWTHITLPELSAALSPH
jgi:hypothetical protein